ncbi:MAG TPA: hypothetical protein VGP07_10955 [Polyangia bacterium]
MTRMAPRRCAPAMVVAALLATTTCSRRRANEAPPVGVKPTVEAVAARPGPPDGGPGAKPRSTKPTRPRAPTVTPTDGGPPVELITIRLLVDPPKRAHVSWGVKDFGLAPLEIRRPRGSGPLDLEVRAPGFLTLHTRVFTEHDNSLSVHLVPETEASRYSGYQSPAPSPHGKTEHGARPIAKRGSVARDQHEVAPVTSSTPQSDANTANNDGAGTP